MDEPSENKFWKHLCKKVPLPTQVLNQFLDDIKYFEKLIQLFV